MKYYAVIDTIVIVSSMLRHDSIPFNKEVLLNHGAISGVNRSELDEREQLVLNEIEKNQSLTAKSISELLNVPFRSVQRYIASLKEKGFIERSGSNKNGHWKILK